MGSHVRVQCILATGWRWRRLRRAGGYLGCDLREFREVIEREWWSDGGKYLYQVVCGIVHTCERVRVTKVGGGESEVCGQPW
jgi:hypothetical protein